MTDATWTIRKNDTDSALFLLHGFTGHLEKSWGRFPACLLAEGGLEDWDIFSLGYPTSFWKWELRGVWKARPGIQKLADTIAARMRHEYGEYQNIAFLAHSMGGLVVQRAVLDDAELRQRVRHAFFFGTPSMGLVKASIIRKLNGKYQIDDMKAGGNFIKRLRRDWDVLFDSKASLFPVQAVAGDEDEFVPSESVYARFPQTSCASVSGDHLSIIKPASADSLSVRLVVNGLQSAGGAESPSPIAAPTIADTRACHPSSEPQPFAEIPSSLEEPVSRSAARPGIHSPGGAVSADSPCYIQRETDALAREAIGYDRAVVILRAPRQTGKTSLMVHLLKELEGEGSPLRPVMINFQRFQPRDLESADAAWRAVARIMARRLGTAAIYPDLWNPDNDIDTNMTDFLENGVFPPPSAGADIDRRPVLLCLDEADALFRYEYASAFYGLVRAFHTAGAHEDAWRKVRWLIASSSEPSFFIKDAYQSPFNLTEPLNLPPFSEADIRKLAETLGLSIGSDMAARIIRYLGGRPYPVHLLLHHMTRRDDAGRECLFDIPTAGDGIFRDHLERYRRQFQEEPELAAAMKQVIAGRGEISARMAERLQAAGLVRPCLGQGGDCRRMECACELYAGFFGSGI